MRAVPVGTEIPFAPAIAPRIGRLSFASPALRILGLNGPVSGEGQDLKGEEVRFRFFEEVSADTQIRDRDGVCAGAGNIAVGNESSRKPPVLNESSVVRMKTIDRSKIAFVFSVGLLSFVLGLAAMEFQTFPYELVHEARSSAGALWRSFRPSQHDRDEASESKEILKAPAVRRHGGEAGGELILVSGGKDYMGTVSPGYGALAWIMDREGSVKHVWHLPEDLWNDLQKVTLLPGKPTLCFGLHLYPNGDLLVTFQGVDSWPYGVGMARFDKDSKLIWKKELLTHHWFTIGDDGRIYSPAQRVADAPYHLSGKDAVLPGKEGKLITDLIMVIDPADGSVVEEIPMIETLVNADRIGFVMMRTDWDPLHLNDVQVVTSELAKTNPLLKAGDMLVSLRNINTLAVIDGKTKRVNWLSFGTMLKQHSPRFFDGGVLAFDNQGGDDKTGGSRLAWVDMTSGESKTLYPRSGSTPPEPFASKFAGHIDISRDNRRALVTLTHSGAVWEIDLENGEVPWEYVYTHPQKPGRRRNIYTAKYVYDVTFPMNRDKENP